MQYKTVAMQKVFDRLGLMSERNEDVMVKGSDFQFLPNGTVKLPDLGIFSFTDWSFSQLCTKLKVPTDFAKRSPKGEGAASRKCILDHWKERTMDDKTWLFRVKLNKDKDEESGSVGRVRAVLSDKYSIYDNLDFVNLLSPIIKREKMVIQMGNVTDQSFHMRALYEETVNVKPAKDAKVGDVHSVGVHFANSEVGSRNISGDFCVFRLVCTNGMIGSPEHEHLFYKRHINLEKHEMHNVVIAGMEQSQMVKMGAIDQLEESAKKKIVSVPEELRRYLTGQPKMSNEILDKCVKAYETEPFQSKYGVIQAMTRAAQGLPIEQRVSLEELAGRYLYAA